MRISRWDDMIISRWDDTVRGWECVDILEIKIESKFISMMCNFVHGCRVPLTHLLTYTHSQLLSTYTYTHTHTHTRTHAHTHTYIWTYIYTYVYAYIYVCIYMYIYMYILIRIFFFIYFIFTYTSLTLKVWYVMPRHVYTYMNYSICTYIITHTRY